MNPEILKELYLLADKFCDEALTESEAARLSELLRGGPDFADRFLEHLGVHARLAWQFGTVKPLPQLAKPAPAGKAGWSFRPTWIHFCLAGVCVAMGLYVALGGRSSASQSVAQLKDTSNVNWGTEAARAPGDSLNRGASLRLESGVAVIEFHCGASAVVEGPAELELVSAAEAFLHKGSVVINVSDKCSDFHLETPTARLTDMGTEFGVSVGRAGETIVQVYQGTVLAQIKNSPTGKPKDKQVQRIVGGQAQRIGDKESREQPFIPDGFIRYLPGPDDPRGQGVRPYNKSKLNAVHIVPAPAGIVIDGDLSDWDLSGRFVSACDPPFAGNYYLEGGMMYDDRFLYLGAHVGDPFPMRSTISPQFMKRDVYGSGGGVALRLSTDRNLGWPVKGESIAIRQGRPGNAWDTNQKLIFMVLWYYAPEQKPCLQLRYTMERREIHINPPGYQGAFRMDKDGRGYTLEYAIPWSLLHAQDDPPRGGDVLGATWLAHWSDSHGQNWKGQLIECVNQGVPGWNFERAATWGKAIYHAKGNLSAP